MAESSAFLMRSLSQLSPTSTEEKQTNPLHRALSTSISFGRFMSESLDWEKWSAFTQNRYLEEIEKYKRPGSVAEKKAYFEARYKRRKAEILLEQENEGDSNMAQQDVTNKFPANGSVDSEYAQKNEFHTNSFADSESAQKDANVISPKASKDKVMNKEVVSAPGTNACGVTLAEEILEDTENPIRKSSNEHEMEREIGNITPSREEGTREKVAILGDSAPSVKKELEFSSAKLLTNNKYDHLTPNNKTVRDLGIKRRSTPRSLHRSINFDTLARETAKASSPGPAKIINSRKFSKHSSNSKESTVPQISTRVSTNSMIKHPTIIPRPENKSYSRSSTNTHESKAQPSTVSSCFVFKSEERAAKRKEFFQKLEEKKKNPREIGKPQLQAKSKEKPKIDFRDLRHSVAFKVPPNGKVSGSMESPDSLMKKEKPKIDSGHLRHSIASKVSPNGKLSHKIESPNNFLKKIPDIHHCDSRIRGKTGSKVQVQDRGSLPTWSFSTKTDGSTKPKDITGKNNRPPIYSAKSFPKKRLHENVSPNVQP